MAFNLQQMLEAFFQGVVAYGGTGMGGSITGNVTGGGGSGSSYGSWQIGTDGQIYGRDADGQLVPLLNPPFTSDGDSTSSPEFDDPATQGSLELVFGEARVINSTLQNQLLILEEMVFTLASNPPGQVFTAEEIVLDLSPSADRDAPPNTPVPSSKLYIHAVFGTAFDALISGGGLLLGGAGNDTITGSGGSDILFGNAGNDTVAGAEGADLLFGGLGDDSLQGGFGNDVLKGEEGNNILEGGAGADTLDGSGGFAVASYRNAWFGVTVDLGDTSRNTGEAAGDTFIDVNGLWGSGHHDTLVGNAHANWIIADGGNDLVQGLAGADTLYGSTGDDTLEGGQGNDVLHGESGNNILEGGEGADAHFGAGGFAVASYRQAAGAVQVYLDGSGTNTGEAQGDTYDSINGLWGSGHADVLVGNHYGNWIIADAGHDSVSGGLGSDTLYGSTGHDTLNGGDDNDTLYGEGGDDALWGNAGADRLLGGDGADALRGEDGDDTLDGGAGTDQLVGGTGRDVFVAEAGSVDGFIDFTAGEDKIQLSGSMFGLGAGALSTASFRQAGVALTGAQKVLYDRGTGDVWYDADGVGAGAAIKLAMIGGGKAVTAADFLIV
jgi:Ca2+-binding RTX toxin-like protein